MMKLKKKYLFKEVMVASEKTKDKVHNYYNSNENVVSVKEE